ncbi:hypothetical protein QBC35DRAFT_513666 [Podospora australis]|uniref:Uncharacterized protein n=1 Tax=Podospora australis TaxID=1536484 RepID=A0AAN6WXG9_9PEZI|nr:hypothetical protein QBC35DRAFT_513666 [Podospora australis]
MEGGFNGQIYAMGPRVPGLSKREGGIPTMTSTLGFQVPHPVLAARAEATTECPDPRLCEKPVGSSALTLPIALGVGIPLVGAVCVLIYLHRRNVKRMKMEDTHDPHKSLDFGMDINPGGVKREKDPSRFNRQQRQQMSMDMNLSSPYLLPPEVHNSRESLNSLARTLKQDDPYNRITQYPTNDSGSIRSFQRSKGDAASVYTRSASRSHSRQDGPMSPGPYSPRSPPRLNHLGNIPNSPLFPPEPSHMKPPQSPLPQIPNTPNSAAPLMSPRSADIEQWEDENVAGPMIQEPAAVAQKDARKSPAQTTPGSSGLDINPFEKPVAQEIETPTESTTIGLGLTTHPEPQQATIHRASMVSAASDYSDHTAQPVPKQGQQAPATAPVLEERAEFYDFDFTDMPKMPRSPSPEDRKPQLDVDEPRGRNMQRTSHIYDQQEGAPSGLGVPQQDSRRLSVGFRPLPPDEIMESEDPEYRANRIRSFYKEYFEDTKPEDRPPMPAMPAQHQQRQQQRPPQQQGGPKYYEDYDAGLQDAPYFDPASNSFVMPYAQPVQRRAMTPPPSGQRFPGPRGPGPRPGPRGPPGPPGIRGPPRPGSSVSNQIGGPSRPSSGASGAYGRPRAGSTMSGGRFGGNGPRSPVPPPQDLQTLPTPSKLRDDSFSILNPIDFAPPENFASRARGRSQSPAGERRPYQMKVPVHSPLVNAFEELPSLPSPHLLRKSNTFTALDFAPPRKIGGGDDRSDAGSIRSNRSGLSSVHANAIRNGAGRVSKLPGDQVFTQAALAETLKPSWGMRDKP